MTPIPDRRGTGIRRNIAVHVPGTETIHPAVREKIAAELREAALRARQFARTLKSPELRESFLRLALKWEAEAQAIDSAP